MLGTQFQTANIKPFLKWAGGKTQLLPAIEAAFPATPKAGVPFTYIEPFVGSGAVLFWVLKKFPALTKAVINDVNGDLTLAYQTIKAQPDALIDRLDKLERAFFERQTHEQKDFFLENRERFNERKVNEVEHTALLIFLNRTCFNGLYRVNSQNKFNVPFGKYKRPTISHPAVIRSVSMALQKVSILQGDFEQTLDHSDGTTFFYLDPPYKPISQSSSFTAYSHFSFDDAEQRRLKAFCDKLNALGHLWLLSNSDPQNIEPGNSFFDDLYQEYHIQRVKARRAINSKASGRGEIHELLISNYPGH